ncbi:hypothetical protein [Raineya orbicola]|jgi:ribosomal protein L24E|uniref:DUF4468 domain-containing protein n=1 Tax=Raineya orbicola TaxID=2016530 RepID=A0A2N3IJX8_9BACT|nr:hypothetical protein [Raineya orbicola]PKQ70640.1 hypothetical protein Rain11_0370 [Raineya orbicola]
MKHLFIVIGIAFGLMKSSLQAQILAEGSWLQGRVMDKEGNLYSGRLKYDTEKQTVMIEVGGVTKTFSARQVDFFEFFDEKVRVGRRFVALPYQKNPNINYETMQFFELIYEGKKATLLGTEYLETRVNPQPGWGWYGMGTTTFSYRIVTEFYALKSNGKIVKLKTSKKKRFFEQMQEPRLTEFIKKNRLSLQQRADMVRIFEYYNNL